MINTADKKSKKTSQELGNCPMGQRDALLKERLFRRKLRNLIKIEKFCQNCEILKYGAKVKILKFG